MQPEDGRAATSSYLDHLTDADLRLLARATKHRDESERDALVGLRARPERLDEVLSDARVHDALYGAPLARDPLVGASPFLVFAVAVHRSAHELRGATSVPEWVGPRERLPVLDARRLSDFLEERAHRLFLAELLASYTRVASGALWIRSRRGWRRHRFSELDVVRLAAMLDVVPERERAGVLRRLGDLALFLTGVFPDHSASFVLGPVGAQRLLRAAGEAGTELAAEGSVVGSLALLEQLGERWYLAACAAAAQPLTSSLRVVASVARRYRDARRVLNFIAERYIWPHRARWFAGPA